MQQKIYSLLMVTHRDMLEKCYRQVFFSDTEIPAVKTFDDYLTDFYLYLYEGKPKHIEGDVKGYYLQQVRDEKALPGWLHSTFRYFLLDENKILRNMQESLSEYRRNLVSSLNSKPIDLTLMHVAFAIAWFNQNETSEDKYLFFRSAYKHFKGFYAWPDTDLDDEDVAKVLDIKQGTLRTRTSRLCAKVKKMVYEVNDAYISSLNKQSLDIANEIFNTSNPDIESILERLLGEAERELPQYEQIIALRKAKCKSKAPFQKLEDSIFAGISLSSSKCVSSHVCHSRISINEEAECLKEEKHNIDNTKDSCNCVNSECIEIWDTDECSSVKLEPTNRIVKLFKTFIEIEDDDFDI